MANRNKARAPEVFELRSAAMTLVVVALKTTDMAAIERELTARFADTPDMFSHDPVVIDIAQAAGDPLAIDYAQLSLLLRRFSMLAAAVRGGSVEQMAAASAAGLGAAPEALPMPVPSSAPTPIAPVREIAAQPATTANTTATTTTATTATTTAATGTESAAPVTRPDADASAHALSSHTAPAMSVMSAAPAAVAATRIVDKPLRSGQQVYARGGDLVVLAAVNFGAEVIADGSIHVYAPLRGKAIAGARGNADARIFSTCMEPELISIAGTYRTTDNPLPHGVLGKPAQIRLDGERLVFEPLA